MDILGELARETAGLTLAQLTERLKLPKTSLLSLLRSFASDDYVAIRNGLYVLGTSTYKLASLIDRKATFPDNVRPILERLAADAQETALIGVLRVDGYTVEAVDVVESARSLRYMTRVGDLTAGHASAMGQAIVAYLDSDLQRRFFRDNPFRRYTNESFNKAEFRSQIASVRQTAMARNIRGFDTELYGLASPVFDANGKVACALCVGGPMSRLDANEARISSLLAAAAAEMSQVLGLRQSYADAAGIVEPNAEVLPAAPRQRVLAADRRRRGAP